MTTDFGLPNPGLATLWQHVVRIQAAIVRFDDRFFVFAATYAAMLIAMLLTNDPDAPTFVYMAFMFPMASLIALPIVVQAWAVSRILWAMATYLVAIGLASLLLPDIPLGVLNRIPRMLPIILYFTAMVAWLTVRARFGFSNFLLVTAGILAISETINVVWFVATQPFLPDWPNTYRLTAHLGMLLTKNATNLSITYVIYFVGCLAMLHDEKASWRRIVFGCLAATLLVGVLMTQSRSAYFAGFISIVSLAALSGRPSRTVLAGGIVIAAALLLLLPPVRQLLDTRGLSYRPEIWLHFFEMAAQRPLLGYGMAPNIDQTMGDGYVIAQAHNILLSALVRGGIIGCAAMIALFSQCLRWAYRTWTHQRRMAPLGMMMAMTAASMFDYQLLYTNPAWEWITFWLPIGVAMGLEIETRWAMRGRAEESPARGTDPLGKKLPDAV